MEGSAEDRWLLCLCIRPYSGPCRHPSPARISPTWLQCSSSIQTTPLRTLKWFSCLQGWRPTSSVAAGYKVSVSSSARLPPLAGTETSWLSTPGHTGETPFAPEMMFSRKHQFFPEDQVVCNSILVSNPRCSVQCKGCAAWGWARLSPHDQEVAEVSLVHSFVLA